MKFFLLLCRKTKQLVASNRIVSIVFVISQVITICAYIFFFTTIIGSYINYYNALEEMNSITVTFPEGKKCSLESVMNIINQSENITAKDTQFVFVDNSEYKHEFISYADLSKSKFSKEDIDSHAKKVVLYNVNTSKNNDSLFKNIKKGGYAVFNGTDFLISDIDYGGVINEIPYTTGFDCLKLDNFVIYLKPNLSDEEKNAVGQSFIRAFEDADVKVPPAMKAEVASSLTMPLAASIVIGISAVFCFCFMYKYMMEKTKRNYIVLRINGCSKKKGISLILLQMFALYLLSFLLGTGLFFLLRSRVFPANLRKLAVSPGGILAVFLSFLLLMALIFVPMTVGFFRKTITREKGRAEI